MAKKTTKKKVFTMSEKVFVKYIKDAFEYDDQLKLHRRNVGAGKARSGRFMRFGEPGQSDLFGIIAKWKCPFCQQQREGVSVEIEVKGIGKDGKRGKPTAAQLKWLDTVEKNNGIALLLYPVETDPIGLNTRIWRLIDRKMCPTCFERRTND